MIGIEWSLDLLLSAAAGRRRRGPAHRPGHPGVRRRRRCSPRRRPTPRCWPPAARPVSMAAIRRQVWGDLSRALHRGQRGLVRGDAAPQPPRQSRLRRGGHGVGRAARTALRSPAGRRANCPPLPPFARAMRRRNADGSSLLRTGRGVPATRSSTFLAEHLPRRLAGHRRARRSRRHLRSPNSGARKLHEHGLLAPAWPTEYGGGGLTKLEQVVLVEELAKAGVPSMGPNDTFSMKMVGGLLLRWGTEEQKAHFLPRILSGEHRWCQGYSEPDSGSDLAGLRTQAVRDGDEWVITGSEDLADARRARRTGSSCSPAPTRRHRSTRASRSCWCRWISRGSRSVRSA